MTQVYTAEGKLKTAASGALAIIIDDTGAGGISYVGDAKPGSGQTTAVWRIKRLTENGDDLTVEFAEGNSKFDNIWTARTGLTYS